MWNIEKLEVVASMPAHDNPVCTLTINGNWLYSGSLKSIKVNQITSYIIINLRNQITILLKITFGVTYPLVV